MFLLSVEDIAFTELVKLFVDGYLIHSVLRRHTNPIHFNVWRRLREELHCCLRRGLIYACAALNQRELFISYLYFLLLLHIDFSGGNQTLSMLLVISHSYWGLVARGV